MPEPPSRATAIFPSDPGTYALVLGLDSATDVEVGRLGRGTFPTGFYIYVGSALGPGGLAGRLRRHAKSTIAPGWRTWWHIDYLRHYTKNVEFWAVRTTISREHGWATLVQQLPESTVTMSGFGSSDCNCITHLFHFSKLPSRNAFGSLLNNYFPEDELLVFKDPRPPA
jgi:Uri superfamily endonuclease